MKRKQSLLPLLLVNLYSILLFGMVPYKCQKKSAEKKRSESHVFPGLVK